MRVCWLALLLFSAAPAAAAQVDNSAVLQAQGMFPFALPTLDDRPGPTDISWLNEKPAGLSGFVSTKGENFIDGAGKPLRLWGVNLNFSGVFPEKELAPRIAARLAKFGFNAVRLHHYEGYAAPNGLWLPAAIGSSKLKLPREVDPEQLDKMDFFVAELIKQGLYVDLNLHVARTLQEAEGFENAAQLPEKDKGIAYFEPRLERELKNFARMMLTHVNPYTTRAYKDEPGFCAIEVANENSLLSLWQDGTLSKLPDTYATTLRGQWNDWLTRTYGSDASLRRAWTEANQPMGSEDLLAVAVPVQPPVQPPVVPPVQPPNNGDPLILPQPPMPGPEPPAVMPGVPTTAVAPAPAAQQPDPGLGGGVTDVQPLPEPPQPNLAAVASLKKFAYALVGGALGRLDVDDLGGPTVEGSVQPAMTATVTTPGSVSWSVQINRDGLNLQEGQLYTCSFWAKADTSRRISLNLWQDQKPFRFAGFTGYADLTSEWQQFTFAMRCGGLDGNDARLAFNLSNQIGTVQISTVTLRSGGRISMPDGATSRGSVPLLEFRTTPIAAARRDFVQFIQELETAHATGMRRFLKDEIGVKVPIWQTQAQFGGWAGLVRESVSDVVDMHAYWKHPDFGGNGWNGSNWRVENASMAAAPAVEPLSGFAFGRQKDKPFVVTEWNSGQPNDYGAESLPMMAGFAASQGWAGVWVFDYHSSGAYDRDKIDGFFSIDSNPVKMVTAPLAALLFRRPVNDGVGEIKAPASGVTLRIPQGYSVQDAANFSGQPSAFPYIKTWTGSGARRSTALDSRTDVVWSNGFFPSPTVADLRSPAEFDAAGAVDWDASSGIWTCTTPQSRLFAGVVGGRTLNLGELTLWGTKAKQFAAGGLTSMDGIPVAESRRLLLVLAGRAENVGMKWNADRTSVGTEWGKGPVHAEGIEAMVRFATEATFARVWSLDAAGQRREVVPSTLRNGVLKFEAGATWQTLWYEIECS